MLEDIDTNEVEETQDDAGEDLRADLEAAFDTETDSEEAPSQSPGEDPKEAAQDDRPRDRDASGRFSKGLPEGQVKEDPAQQVSASPTDSSIPAPISWAGANKELFKQLPKALQEEVSRRELERERAFTQRAEETARYKRTYQDIEDAFAPHKRELDVAGVSQGQVVRQLLSMQEWMQSEPKAAINHILQSYNLTPQDLVEAQAGQPPQDPRFQSLQEELEQLKGYIGNQQEQEANQSRFEVENEIQTFANEKSADGSLARPHFQDVYYEMLPIAQALREANPDAAHRDILAAAYDRAIYSHPEVRKTVISRLTEGTQAKRINDAKTQAQKARNAGSSVRGTPGGSLAPVAPDDLRATIEQAFEDFRL